MYVVLTTMPKQGSGNVGDLLIERSLKELVTRETGGREFVTFSVNDEPYALPIERVREIVRLRPITPVPRVPAAVIGVISLRGEVVQVVDLRRRLGMPTREPTRTSRIVVLHGDDGSVTGILVDTVRDVLRITDDQIRLSGSADAEAVAALLVRGEEFVSLLDIEVDALKGLYAGGVRLLQTFDLQCFHGGTTVRLDEGQAPDRAGGQSVSQTPSVSSGPGAPHVLGHPC